MNTDTVELTRRRRITVRLLAAVGLVAFSFMLVFVVSDAMGRVGQIHQLEPAGSPEAQIGADHPGEMVHITGAVGALVLGATGLVALIARPQRAGSATQAGAATVAMLITIGIVGDPDNHGGQGLFIDPAFLILALPPLAAAAAAAPWRAWRHGAVRRPRLLAFALLAFPAVWYGLDQGLMQRNTWPPLADPHHQAHWYAMSVFAFATVLVVAGAALHGKGWRLGATSAGAAASALAVSSLLEPASASALPALWAVLVLAWAAAVLAVTWLQARHTDASSDLPGEPTGVTRPAHGRTI